MRALFSCLLPLLLYAQTPSITSIQSLTGQVDPTRLLTVGGEQLLLRGTNFGTSSAALSYIGPSPFQNGFTVRYTPLIQTQNDTTILFTTTPGVGANLQFTVTRQANNASTTSPPLASYSAPTILIITGVGSVNPFALKPQGGDLLRIIGMNFGPRSYPGYPSIYTPWVRFGGIPGTWAWMQACSRTATDFDTVITCRTPVGGGTNHTVRVNAGYTGQWSPIDRNKTVSFVTPTVLSTTPTFSSMTTAGGDQIVIRGLNMPFPSWVIQGFCPIMATFGILLPNSSSIPPFQTPFYTMRSCTGAFDGDGRTPVITCLSPEGTGKGFSLSVVVGGLPTNIYRNPLQQIGYAPPVIYDFQGASTAASTLGNEVVLINGKNFGMNATKISATYTLTLKSPLFNTTHVIYTSPSCSVTNNHTQLGCRTAPGVGQDLSWILLVDGQENINPKTGYAAPILTSYTILNATTLLPKPAASTRGGDILKILGSGFGVPQTPLYKDVVAVSPFGLIVPLPNVTLVSDSELRVVLPPGGGDGWSVTLKIADITNEPTTANYSYANPTLFAIQPSSAKGGSLITLFASDLTLGTPTLITVAAFGSPSDGSLLPFFLPTSLVQRLDNSSEPFYTDRVTIQLPPGAGLRRYVRLLTYLAKDTPPDPATLPLERGIYINYEDPVIQNTVLSQVTTPQQLQTALNFFGAALLSYVRVLTLFGINFGSGSYPLSTRMIQYLNTTWKNSTTEYAFDPTEWSDSSITLYTLESVGTVRLLLGSLDLTSQEFFQVSNSFPYNDFSPTITTNSTGRFPTVGGSTLPVSAAYLASATGFNITIAGSPADILDPSSGLPLTQAQVYSRILTNPSCFSPPGSFTPQTVWTFSVRVPPGQGSQAPLLLTRLPDISVSAPSFLAYEPPSLIGVNGAPFDPYTRYTSPTLGTLFTLSGTNFGPCPSVQLATYSLPCRPGSVSPDHTLLSIQIPPGEGLGTDLLGTSAGWTLQVSSGDQHAPPILFGWDPPQLISLSYTSLPTQGGSLLLVRGVNFGESVPGYPQASLPPSLQIAVLFNSTQSQELCQNPIRSSHTLIQCETPASAGLKRVTVRIAGQESVSFQPLLYDPPSFSTVQNITLNTSSLLTLQGENFGPTPQFSCIFFSNRYATQTPICNGQEDFPGEGEQPGSSIRFWNHTQIQLLIPPGTGSPRISVDIWGQQAPLNSSFSYPPPTLFNISQSSGPSRGAYPVTLFTEGVGFAPTSQPYPRPLPSRYYSPIHITMNGFCLSSVPRAGCESAIFSYTDSSIKFTMPEGVGANYTFTVSIDDPFLSLESNPLTLWSYDSPILQQFSPNPVLVGLETSPSVVLQGENLGTPQAFVNFPATDRSVFVSVDSVPQMNVKRISTADLPVAIEFTLDSTKIPAGKHQTHLLVAGQVGSLTNTSFRSLQVVCEKEYFASSGEFCLPCPQGGMCPGGLQYPIALPGFFNLNSSYTNAELCPASARIQSRDVCLTACSPAEACIGRNLCAEGYTSVAPAYRCNICAKGFYKRANECLKCTDSPTTVIVGAALIVMTLAAVGFFLNRYTVNMAFVSIAIDYFQVISIFLQSKIAWPPVIKSLMYILSAFNLNLDIVAPECLIPDISYSQKFYFIQALPMSLIGILCIVHSVHILYKWLILGRERKELWRHVSSLYSTGIIIMYFLYLYTTRTLLDVFNCSPTVPPTYDKNGKLITYLSVQFEECGTPGGLQERLTPVAVLGMLVYILGFPAFIAYVLMKNKVNIMFDQLLRAQNEGDNRFENPIAYETRKAYSRLYYQYKPDFYGWSLMILGRKFCIAVTSVLFASNASFQISACLLILFISYAFQTRMNPFMSYSDFQDVLRNHVDAVSWSSSHMRIHAMFLSVNAKNKVHKKTHTNKIFSATGVLNKEALFKAVGSWIFNYNTVEAVMLFCGVIVCLMGSMYQSQMVASGFDSTGRDIITGVVLFTLIGSILYLFSVFCVEIYLAFAKYKKASKLHTVKKFSIQAADSESTTETNPMMMKARLSNQINVDAFDQPPPAAMWPYFKEMFKKNSATIESLNATITDLKKKEQRAPAFLEMSPVRVVKRVMGPVKSLNLPGSVS